MLKGKLEGDINEQEHFLNENKNLVKSFYHQLKNNIPLDDFDSRDEYHEHIAMIATIGLVNGEPYYSENIESIPENLEIYEAVYNTILIDITLDYMQHRGLVKEIDGKFGLTELGQKVCEHNENI